MKGIMLPPLEAAMNAALRMDVQAMQRLAELEGQLFQLTIEDWDVNFYLLPTPQGILLRAESDEKPSACIYGTLNGLFRVGLAKGSNTALFDNKIRVTGDLEAGEQLRHIFSELNIDWEEQLSHFVGDVTAHKVGELARQIKDSFAQTRATVGLNLKEFLQFEVHALPCKSELQRFIAEVTELRHHTDRLIARVDRLQHRGKHP